MSYEVCLRSWESYLRISAVQELEPSNGAALLAKRERDCEPEAKAVYEQLWIHKHGSDGDGMLLQYTYFHTYIAHGCVTASSQETFIVSTKYRVAWQSCHA